jgi:hypothetical protein
MEQLMKNSLEGGTIIPHSVREPFVLPQQDPVRWIILRESSTDIATYRDNAAPRTWRDSEAWGMVKAAFRRVTQRGDAVHTSTMNALPLIDTTDDYITDRYWGATSATAGNP